MNHALIIAPHFNCAASANGLIYNPFIKYMVKERGLNCTVYCSDERHGTLGIDGVDVRVIKRNVILLAISKIIERSKLKNLLNTPDVDRYIWNRKCFRAIRRDNKVCKYDYVISYSFPCSMHQIALRAKRDFGIPWMAIFFDPWFGNPYRQIPNFLKEYDKRAEAEIAQNADIITHTNPFTKDEWIQRYGKAIEPKIKVLRDTNCISFEVPAATICSMPKTICHIGSLIDKRNSLPFIEAVNILAKEHLDLNEQLRVEYVGRVSEREIELINKYQLQDIFHIVGVIPVEQCVQYYDKADVFLAFDSDDNYNVFFPSKIINYFFAKKPILGIVNGNSVLERELEESGHFSRQRSDIDGIVAYLKMVIDSNPDLYKFDTSYCEQFRIENVAHQYERLIAELNANK